MEFHRFRSGLKRLRSRAAFSLAETMVAFSLIGIAALITASGLTVALNMYESANELRSVCDKAAGDLYTAAQSGETFDIIDISCPEVGTVKRTGEFAPESSEGVEIDVYAVCTVLGSKFTDGNNGIIFYYYQSSSDD